MRYSRQGFTRLRAAQDQIARAEQDYDRLRAAYVQIARVSPEHEVALALIGADVDRAYAALQALVGLRPLPFSPDRSEVLRRRAATDNKLDHLKAAND
ncbi:MAG: hypothetical protein LCH79_02990 [Proteobacteria bacterium]|jgi:hypothetical protein|nr:hypothetical protein [Ramlibacter sp.]MCA0212123.1 hypothetical protein [Pseudomonadota bacterium]